MTLAEAEFEALRRRIADRNDPELPPVCVERLAVTKIGQNFDLDFYGEAYGDSYDDLLATVAKPENASTVRSLKLCGPDEGANGVRNWNLTALLENSAVFTQLENLYVQLTQPGDHNVSIVASSYDEEGILADIALNSPKLAWMTAPSAPCDDFFDLGERPIKFLSFDAGVNTQNFVLNLANSNNFPNLTCLQWGEHTLPNDHDESRCTPLSSFRKLFESAVFEQLRLFVWRNPTFSDDEISELKRVRPNLQLRVVNHASHWVRI